MAALAKEEASRSFQFKHCTIISMADGIYNLSADGHFNSSIVRL